jgi:hypothetical protein
MWLFEGNDDLLGLHMCMKENNGQDFACEKKNMIVHVE